MSTATSTDGSTPRTVAATRRPPRSTSTVARSPTTCAFVTTWPRPSTRKPEPGPVAGVDEHDRRRGGAVDRAHLCGVGRPGPRRLAADAEERGDPDQDEPRHQAAQDRRPQHPHRLAAHPCHGEMVRGTALPHRPRAGWAPPRTDGGRGSRPGAEPPYTEPMRTSYTLGRVAGIEIGINWSVLALLALIMWTLAPGSSRTRTRASATTPTSRWRSSPRWASSPRSCCTSSGTPSRRAARDADRRHHPLALRRGRPLQPGCSPPRAPSSASRSPARWSRSLLAAGLLGATCIPGLPEPVDAVCAWLGIINAALLIFNLIAALPLDGGRMLRAALWQLEGRPAVGHRLAAGSGRILSIVMIGLGWRWPCCGDGINGVWLALIGWFVLQAAGAEAQMVGASRRRWAAGGRHDGRRPGHDPPGADAGRVLPSRRDRPGPRRVRRARRRRPAPSGSSPQAPSPRCRRRSGARGRWPTAWSAARNVPALTAEASLDDAMEALRRSPVRRVLVVDGERLVGLLSLDDVARTLGLRVAGPDPLGGRSSGAVSPRSLRAWRMARMNRTSLRISARQVRPSAAFTTTRVSSMPALNASTSVRPASPASITTSSACWGPRPPGVAGKRPPRLPATSRSARLGGGGDAEGGEEGPRRADAAAPPDHLPGHDRAQVARRGRRMARPRPNSRQNARTRRPSSHEAGRRMKRR